MGCNSNCGESCNTSCESKKEEVKENDHYIISYTDHVSLEEIEQDGAIIRRGIFDESVDVILDDTVIYDASFISLVGSSLYIYGVNSDDIPIFKVILRDKKYVRVDETDDIIILSLVDSEIESKEQYPLYDMRLKDIIDEEDNRSYVCSIDASILPGVPYRKIYEISGGNSEQLLFNAKAIIYELQSLSGILKEIELGNTRYLINDNTLYKILENGFGGLRLQDIEDEDKVYVLQYPLIARSRDLYLLDKGDIYFDGINMYRDNGKDIAYTKFNMYDLIKSVNSFLVKSTEYEEEGFSEKDLIELHDDTIAEISGIGASDDTNIVLLNNINSHAWTSITIDNLNKIKDTIIDKLKEDSEEE